MKKFIILKKNIKNKEIVNITSKIFGLTAFIKIILISTFYFSIFKSSLLLGSLNTVVEITYSYNVIEKEEKNISQLAFSNISPNEGTVTTQDLILPKSVSNVEIWVNGQKKASTKKQIKFIIGSHLR
jgi:hypothetical protein